MTLKIAFFRHFAPKNCYLGLFLGGPGMCGSGRHQRAIDKNRNGILESTSGPMPTVYMRKIINIFQFFDQSRHFVLELGHHFYTDGKPSSVRVDWWYHWGYKMCKGKKLRAIFRFFGPFLADTTRVRAPKKHSHTGINHVKPGMG